MFERFKGITNEEKAALTFDDFTVSELKFLIEETVLTDRDRQIAELKLCRAFTIERICNKFDYDDKTIEAAVFKIKDKVKKTIQKVL
jgi:hypothetical protein